MLKHLIKYYIMNTAKKSLYCLMFCLDFQYKQLNMVKIKKHLLEKQNYLRYCVLFSEKYTKFK